MNKTFSDMSKKNSRERRRWKRRQFTEEVFLYVRNGKKRELETINIGAGGILLKSADLLPIGTQIAVVLKRQANYEDPIFLIGRVVRIQEKPIKGFAIQWEKAVSSCSNFELSLFLSSVFGFVDAFVKQKKIPGTQKIMSVYIFDTIETASIDIKTKNLNKPIQEPNVRESQPEFILSQEVGKSKLIQQDRAITISKDGMAFAKYAKPIKYVTKKGKQYAGSVSPTESLNSNIHSTGPITKQLTARDLTLPVAIKTTLFWEDELNIKVFIYRLGYSFIQVQSPLVPPDKVKYVTVILPVSQEDNKNKISCLCKIRNVKNVGVKKHIGLDLDIVEINEFGNEGLFNRFIKSLVFIQLASD